jgi:arylformamidase
MKAIIKHKKQEYKINLAKPIDISIPIRNGKNNVNAWYVPPPIIEAVRDGDFIGSVSEGASTNFNNIAFNPHAHGTHTECLGHITQTFYSINTLLKQFFFVAELITIPPGKLGKDYVISKKQLANALGEKLPEALVIRTLPNDNEKLSKQYSHTNPPYLLEEAAVFLRTIGVKHLLIDLPSIDKEKDEGKLLAHKAFWNVNDDIRFDATITEFIFVPHAVEDGSYILNLQIAPFENDATPSKPVLYKIINRSNQFLAI